MLKLLLLPLPPPTPKKESFNILPFKQLVFKLLLELFIEAVIEAVIDDIVEVVILDVDAIILPNLELPLIERGRRDVRGL